MPKAISNTSPLLYLYKIGAINLLPQMFDEVWTAESVKNELLAGRSKGYDVPNPADYTWLNIVNPKSMPSEWLALKAHFGLRMQKATQQLTNNSQLGNTRRDIARVKTILAEKKRVAQGGAAK